jgi:hypothetical protein
MIGGLAIEILGIGYQIALSELSKFVDAVNMQLARGLTWL